MMPWWYARRRWWWGARGRDFYASEHHPKTTTTTTRRVCCAGVTMLIYSIHSKTNKHTSMHFYYIHALRWDYPRIVVIASSSSSSWRTHVRYMSTQPCVVWCEIRINAIRADRWEFKRVASLLGRPGRENTHALLVRGGVMVAMHSARSRSPCAQN